MPVVLTVCSMQVVFLSLGDGAASGDFSCKRRQADWSYCRLVPMVINRMQSIIASAFSMGQHFAQSLPSSFLALSGISQSSRSSRSCQAAWPSPMPFRLPEKPYLEQMGRNFQDVHYQLLQTEGCPSRLYGRSLAEAKVTARNAMQALDPHARVDHIPDAPESLMEGVDVTLYCNPKLDVPRCHSSATIVQFQQAAGALQAALLTVPDKCQTLEETAEVITLLGSIGNCRSTDDLQAVVEHVHTSDNLSRSTLASLRPALAFVSWRLSESFDYPAWQRRACGRSS